MARWSVVATAALLVGACTAPDGSDDGAPSAPAIGEAVGTAAEPSIEIVEIETVRLPGRLWDPFLPPLDEGTPVTIEGALTVPPSEAPVPAVIIEHGCGGVSSGERDWVAPLVDQGVATLVLDSFGARQVSEVCTGRETLNVADLIVDVYRSADFLRDDPRIDGERIAVMGFSFGGRTALWSALTRFQDAYDGTPLQGYAAFYPSTCFIRLDDEAGVAGGPIRIFHGTADDYTPIEPCRDLVDRLAAAGVDAALFEYPDAHHSFDNRSLAWGVLLVSPDVPSPRGCTFVEQDGVIVDPDTGGVAGVGSPCVERGVSYGYDPDARHGAERDLARFLDEIFS